MSPDGKSVAAFYTERPESTQDAPNGIAILPFKGGKPEQVFPIDNTVNHTAALRWTPDGTGVSYVKTEHGVGNVWVQPLSSAPARKVTNLTGDRIFYFCWSPDGKTLFVVRGTLTNDIVLLRAVQ